MTALIGIIIAVVVLISLGLLIYNGLVALKNKVDEGWADIETQLKKRYDLIPNLVNTVKGYAKHESKTFESVTAARTAAMSAQGPAEKQKAENMLTGALKSIFALAENYPELKANQNFLQLQTTLQEVEEHIQLSRRYYNATVRDYNTRIESVPSNIIAGMFHFTKRDFFEIENPEERAAPKVSFEDEKPAEESPMKEEQPKEEEPKKEEEEAE